MKGKHPALVALARLRTQREHFRSGVTAPTSMRAFVDADEPFGITMSSCPPACLHWVENYTGHLPVFIDSGAYAEWKTGATLSIQTWKKRYREVEKISKRLQNRAFVVLPDRIGSPEESLKRVWRLRSIIGSIAATGAILLVPMQRMTAGYLKEVAELLGLPARRLVPAIPMPALTGGGNTVEKIKKMVEALVKALAPPGLHLLGASPLNPKYNPIFTMVSSQFPGLRVTSDSVARRKSVGYDEAMLRGQQSLTRIRFDELSNVDPQAAIRDAAGDIDRVKLVRLVLKSKPRGNLREGHYRQAAREVAHAVGRLEPDIDRPDPTLRQRAYDYLRYGTVDPTRDFDVVADHLAHRLLFQQTITASGRRSGLLSDIVEQATARRLSGPRTTARSYERGRSFVLQGNLEDILNAKGEPYTRVSHLSKDLDDLRTEIPGLTAFGLDQLIRSLVNRPLYWYHLKERLGGDTIPVDVFGRLVSLHGIQVYDLQKPTGGWSSRKVDTGHPANDPSWLARVMYSGSIW